MLDLPFYNLLLLSSLCYSIHQYLPSKTYSLLFFIPSVLLKWHPIPYTVQCTTFDQSPKGSHLGRIHYLHSLHTVYQCFSIAILSPQTSRASVVLDSRVINKKTELIFCINKVRSVHIRSTNII